jgi:hypothetical protein
MFVYGVRCAPSDLLGLATDASVDYYMDHGLLVFPAYTRATCLKGSLSSEHFLSVFRQIAETPQRAHIIDVEQPYISDSEAKVLRSLREAKPLLEPEWFYIPSVAATNQSVARHQ